ncbi:MAG TPA: hypothetical protein VIB00_07235 [Pyrinomonadaceae bacterium]|jgi:hypothetical protein
MSDSTPRTKQELIIAVWESLDCESVGAGELKRIQEEILLKFGPGAVESPAAIARLLADEGAVLRHPEVLSCDSEWRQTEFADAAPLDQFLFSNISEAENSIKQFEAWRREVTAAEPDSTLPRQLGLELKRMVELVAQSPIVKNEDREVAGEVIQWLNVWLQQPLIFSEWLDLRKRSPEFIERFPRG